MLMGGCPFISEKKSKLGLYNGKSYCEHETYINMFFYIDDFYELM